LRKLVGEDDVYRRPDAQREKEVKPSSWSKRIRGVSPGNEKIRKALLFVKKN